MVKMIVRSSKGVDGYCIDHRLGRRPIEKTETRRVYDVTDLTAQERSEARNDIIWSWHYSVLIDDLRRD